MEKTIAVIWGDCSSPEIVAQAVRVLDRIAEKYGHTFHYVDTAMGGEAIDKYGDPLPQQELDKCLAADSVLLGAVGGPKWEGLPGPQRPEKGCSGSVQGWACTPTTAPPASGRSLPPPAR